MASVKRKRLGYWFLFGFSILVLIYVCGIGIENMFRYRRFKIEANGVEVEYREALQTNMIYRQRLREMENSDFWEHQAKLRLGYVLPGEVVYRLVSL